jgi:hypothetical protein
VRALVGPGHLQVRGGGPGLGHGRESGVVDIFPPRPDRGPLRGPSARTAPVISSQRSMMTRRLAWIPSRPEIRRR